MLQSLKLLRLVEPKTRKSRRTVRLPDFVYQALSDHWGQNEGLEGLMFTTSGGTTYSSRNFFRDLKAQSRAAGLPEIRFHDMRHSCISWLIAMGVPLRGAEHRRAQQGDVMEKMGDVFD